MLKSESVNDLFLALSMAQNNYLPLKKECDNPFFKSKYADLSACIEATRRALSDNGLSVVQVTESEGDGVVLVTVLAHKSGQWIAGRYPVIVAKKDPQGFGSGLTYARRYAYSAILGIASEDDDDGEGATERKTNTAPTKPQPRPENSDNANSDKKRSDCFCLLLNIEVKTSSTNKKYYLANLRDDNRDFVASTFSDTVYNKCAALVGENVKASIIETVKNGKTYRNIEDIEPVGNKNNTAVVSDDDELPF
jgi:hypothetical protein